MIRKKPTRLKNTYQHLFFDLDHTLWDFDKNSNETIIELYEEGNFTSDTGADARQFLHKYRETNAALWQLYRHGKITKDRLRIKRFEDAFAFFGFGDNQRIHRFEQNYLYQAPRKTALMDGAEDLLLHLKGKYRIHIITNGFAETQHVKLERCGLKPYFDLIMTSDEIKVNKPEAKIFIESMKRTGANRKNSLMVGDNLHVDILGARNVGIDQVYYNPHRQTHSEKPTHEVKHLSEMKEIL